MRVVIAKIRVLIKVVAVLVYLELALQILLFHDSVVDGEARIVTKLYTCDGG